VPRESQAKIRAAQAHTCNSHNNLQAAPTFAHVWGIGRNRDLQIGPAAQFLHTDA
jgi:hypothetical protein